MIRDINHTDDSPEACEQFRVRSNQRHHIEVPTMTGRCSFENTVKPLLTNQRKAGLNHG
jgi:hypothetical protein